MLGEDINFLTGEDRRTDCLPNLIEGTSLQNINLTYYDDFTLYSSSQRQWNSVFRNDPKSCKPWDNVLVLSNEKVYEALMNEQVNCEQKMERFTLR